jgi:hypothetical protein
MSLPLTPSRFFLVRFKRTSNKKLDTHNKLSFEEREALRILENRSVNQFTEGAVDVETFYRSQVDLTRRLSAHRRSSLPDAMAVAVAAAPRRGSTKDMKRSPPPPSEGEGEEIKPKKVDKKPTPPKVERNKVMSPKAASSPQPPAGEPAAPTSTPAVDTHRRENAATLVASFLQSTADSAVSTPSPLATLVPTSSTRRYSNASRLPGLSRRSSSSTANDEMESVEPSTTPSPAVSPLPSQRRLSSSLSAPVPAPVPSPPGASAASTSQSPAQQGRVRRKSLSEMWGSDYENQLRRASTATVTAPVAKELVDMDGSGQKRRNSKDVGFTIYTTDDGITNIVSSTGAIVSPRVSTLTLKSATGYGSSLYDSSVIDSLIS